MSAAANSLPPDARPSAPDTLRSALADLARAQGFAAFAVAAATEATEAREITLRRVAEGQFDGLPWFDAARVERAARPTSTLPGARSIVLLAASYAHPDPPSRDGRLRGRISRYAHGRDYHRVLEKRARPLARLLDASAPDARSRILVDHGPLLERAFARAGGLGWQGRNTMILTRGIGSYTFLAAILTTVDLGTDRPTRQGCGSCQRCLPSCPTGALRSEYELVNDLCIAFHTIENRGPIPRDMRPLIGDWVFGCDLCQEACPVNDTTTGPALPDFLPRSVDDARPDLLDALALSEAAFRERFAGRPILRAKYAGFLRNVCVALGNLGDPVAIPALATALAHDERLVRGHAAWALGRLGAREPLADRLPVEDDPWVREEIDLALGEAAATA